MLKSLRIRLEIAKFGSILQKTGIEFSQKNENVIFRLQRLGFMQKIANSNEEMDFGQFLAKMGKTR